MGRRVRQSEGSGRGRGWVRGESVIGDGWWGGEGGECCRGWEGGERGRVVGWGGVEKEVRAFCGSWEGVVACGGWRGGRVGCQAREKGTAKEGTGFTCAGLACFCTRAMVGARHIRAHICLIPPTSPPPLPHLLSSSLPHFPFFPHLSSHPLSTFPSAHLPHLPSFPPLFPFAQPPTSSSLPLLPSPPLYPFSPLRLFPSTSLPLRASGSERVILTGYVMISFLSISLGVVTFPINLTVAKYK